MAIPMSEVNGGIPPPSVLAGQLGGARLSGMMSSMVHGKTTNNPETPAIPMSASFCSDDITEGLSLTAAASDEYSKLKMVDSLLCDNCFDKYRLEGLGGCHAGRDLLDIVLIFSPFQVECTSYRV